MVNNVGTIGFINTYGKISVVRIWNSFQQERIFVPKLVQQQDGFSIDNSHIPGLFVTAEEHISITNPKQIAVANSIVVLPNHRAASPINGQRRHNCRNSNTEGNSGAFFMEPVPQLHETTRRQPS